MNVTQPDSRPYDTGFKIVLAVGFLAVAFAVIRAYQSPATGYELSLYRATPLTVWVAAGLALFAGLYVSLGTARPDLRRGAVLVGGLATFVLAALPLLRGYYYYGLSDALTHLGWAKDFATGAMDPLGLLYPGTHSIAVFVHQVTGTPLRRAIMLTVVLFVVAFLVFVPLVVSVFGSRHALAIGAFSAFLLLPINNVSAHLVAHPSTQATLFVPFVVYLLLRYLREPPFEIGRISISPTGALLALATTAILLVHPQQTANVLILFGSICAVQLVARRVAPTSRIADHRPLFAQTAWLAVVFLVWVPRFDRATGTVTTLVSLVVSGPQVGGDIGQRGVALAQIGSGIEELFLKLFLVSAVYTALTGLIVLGALAGRLDLDPDTRAFVAYFAAGTVPLTGLFGMFYATSYSIQHFRILGFLMVIGTLLGAAAVSIGLTHLRHRFSGGSIRAVVTVGLAVFLVLSVPIMFSSPYIYKTSGHVSTQQISGYETAFDHRDPDVLFTGLRGHSPRFGDAIMGYSESGSLEPSGAPYADARLYGSFTDEHSFSAANLRAYFREPRYLPITETDRLREIQVFDGLRFSERGFESLETQPGIHRVHANEEFTMYLIDDGDESEEDRL